MGRGGYPSMTVVDDIEGSHRFVVDVQTGSRTELVMALRQTANWSKLTGLMKSRDAGVRCQIRRLSINMLTFQPLTRQRQSLGSTELVDLSDVLVNEAPQAVCTKLHTMQYLQTFQLHLGLDITGKNMRTQTMGEEQRRR